MRRLALVFALAAPALVACETPPARTATDSQAQAQDQDQDQDHNQTPTGPAAEPAPPASTCAAAPLQAELTRYCEFDLGVPPIELAEVSWSAPSYHPQATRVISLDAAGLRDPEAEGSAPVSVSEWLANPPRRLPEPGAMVFAIAAEVPLATLAELWAGLADVGREQIRVLVHVAEPGPIPAPRNPQMLADMRASLPSQHDEKIMFVAKGVRGYAQACPALGAAFGQLASVGSDERCATLAKLSAAALVQCSCAQEAAIMTLLYGLTVGFDVPRGRAASVSLRLDPAAGTHVEGNPSWGELAPQLLPDAEPRALWLGSD